MKSKQFCSVCKQWLDMEVVPTGDGDDDDGVVWFRCPRCQGFLPKLSSNLEDAADADDSAAASETAPAAVDDGATDDSADDLPWESPADMLAAQDVAQDPEKAEIADDVADDASPEAAKEEDPPPPPSEPIAEYAAQLAEMDAGAAIPYRPWETYEVGQCVHHLAWEECGVVVAKEDIPGGRHVIKCYFAAAGVVRLIERDSQ